MDTLIRDFAPYDYPVLAAVRNAACPRDPTSAGQLKDGDERYPEAIKRGRWVAELRDCVVGVGEYTQSTDLYHPTSYGATSRSRIKLGHSRTRAAHCDFWHGGDSRKTFGSGNPTWM